MTSKRRTPRSIYDYVFFGINYLIFSLFAIICIYPFYYLLICTISNNHMVDMGQIVIAPKGIHFENYVKVLQIENLFNAARISALRTVFGTMFGVSFTTYLAYFFTKEAMWGRKIWYRFLVITMYFSAGLIPSYMNNRALGLLNTFWIYIVPGLLSVYNMILIKTSIEAMPSALEESAYLDGAGYIRRLIYIVIPLQKPILATVCLFSAVGHWNDFFTTKLNITSPSLYTLQFQLYELLQQVISASSMIDQAVRNDPQAMGTAISPTAIRMTLTSIVVIPIIMVYPFIQKYYVKGVMIGAVKG